MIAGFKAEHHDGDAAVGGAGVEGLLRIEDAAVRRIEPRLRDGAHGARRGEEGLEANRRAGAEFRTRLQSHPGARDHAKRSFRTDQQPVGARSCARARQAARFQDAARRHHAQVFDEIVDVRIKAGEMAARPGRDPAAQRRILEALRKVPQGDAMRLELVLQRGTIGAAFDQRGARGLVDLDHLAEMAQIECDGGLVADAVGARLDTAADAGAAAERRQRGADTAGPVHHGGNLCFAAGVGDDVGRAIVVAEHGAHVIGIGLAVGMCGAVVAVGGAEGGERGRRRYPRRAQAEILKPRHRDGLEPVAGEFRAVTAEHKGLLGLRHAFAFAAPAIVLQPCAGHGRLPEFPPEFSGWEQSLAARRTQQAPEIKTLCRRPLAGNKAVAAGRTLKVPTIVLRAGLAR